MNLCDNYLDIFEKKFDFIESYDLFTLKELLIKLNSNKNKLENFKKNFSELRNFIQKGFNKVNEKNLNIFSGDLNGN